MGLLEFGGFVEDGGFVLACAAAVVGCPGAVLQVKVSQGSATLDVVSGDSC